MMHTIIFEGDWGGQIYATYHGPIEPSVGALEAAINSVNNFEWPCNEGRGAEVRILSGKKPGNYILGGMGGGRVVNGLWLHKDLHPKSVVILQKLFGD